MTAPAEQPARARRIRQGWFPECSECPCWFGLVYTSEAVAGRLADEHNREVHGV